MILTLIFAALCLLSIAVMVFGMVKTNQLQNAKAARASQDEDALNPDAVHDDSTPKRGRVSRSRSVSFSAEMDAREMWEGVNRGDAASIYFFLIVTGAAGIFVFFMLAILSIVM